MNGTQYSLTFTNYSNMYGNVCVYQKFPEVDSNSAILAWLVKPTHPTTIVTFTWTTDYGFIWAETGRLAPGVVFNASQVWPADLTQNNKVTLSFLQEAFTFQNLTKGDTPGALEIVQDATIPPERASIGIAMAGAGIFAMQAKPNMSIFIQPPMPEYWIAFGNYQPGQVLDITQINNQQKLEFGPGVYSLSATLYKNNSWDIEQNG
ncbi:MAG TPA: protein rhiA [Clostridia bacterium]|nr:protein rhiA [Clostridia bacterium]